MTVDLRLDELMPTIDRAWAWLLHLVTADRALALVALVTAILTLLLSNRQLTLTQRAWITVKTVSFTDYNVVGRQPHIEIILQNTGPTPANDVVGSIDSMPSPKARLAGRMPPLDWSDPQRATVGPNTTLRYTWEFTDKGKPYVLTAERVADIWDNRLYLFVYGETRYRDIFGKEHHTTWCSYQPDLHDPGLKARMCNVWNIAQ